MTDLFRAQMKARVRGLVAAELARKRVDRAREEYEKKFSDKIKFLTETRNKVRAEREAVWAKKIAAKSALLASLANKCLHDGEILVEKMAKKDAAVADKRARTLAAHRQAAEEFAARLETVHQRVRYAENDTLNAGKALVVLLEKKYEKAVQIRRFKGKRTIRPKPKIVPPSAVCQDGELIRAKLAAAAARRSERMIRKVKEKKIVSKTVVEKKLRIFLKKSTPSKKRVQRYDVLETQARMKASKWVQTQAVIARMLGENLKLEKKLAKSENVQRDKQKLIRMSFIERGKISRFITKIQNTNNEFKFLNLVKRMGIPVT